MRKKMLFAGVSILMLALSVFGFLQFSKRSTHAQNFAEVEGLVFYFGSGVGAWSTELEIQPDGSFSGYYHDANAGETGDGYPGGTLYQCGFSGKLAPPARTGDYTFTTKLLSLELEQTPGEETISEGMLVISAAPYGLDDADEFTLYRPGIALDALPGAFVDWVSIALGEDDTTLPFYGLYNSAGEKGFSSYAAAG